MRGAELLGVPVGGGPPASRPRRELRSARRLEARPGPATASLISHVIPLCLIQTLNLHRWNCNVCGPSRKMTTINYVRNLAGGSVVAAHGCRGRAPSFVAGPGSAVVQHPLEGSGFFGPFVLRGLF